MRTLRLLRRRAKWIAGAALLLGVAGYLSAAVAQDEQPVEVVPVRYAARHTIIVNNQVSGDARLPGTENLLGIAQRIVLGEIPKGVGRTLGRDADDVGRRLRVTVRLDTQTVTITAFDESPDGAAALADTTAETLLGFLNRDAAEIYQDRLDKAQAALQQAEAGLQKVRADLAAARRANDAENVRQLEEDESLYVGLRIRANSDLLAAKAAGVPVVPLESLEPAKTFEVSSRDYDRALVEGAAGQNVRQLDPNDKEDSGGSSGGGPAVPSSPLARGVGGFLGGLFLALAAVVAFDRLDPRIRSKEDVERLLDLPVIAEIPALSRRARKRIEVIARVEPLSPAAESFRRFRSALDYASLTAHRQPDAAGIDGAAGGEVVLITSPGPSEGKSTSVANLAAVMAEHNRHVLVINCDFRRPRVQQYLGGAEAPQKVHDTGVPGVNLITHVLSDESAASPAEVVTGQRKVIERARNRFDTILLDTAPLLTTNDAADLLPAADMVVLIIRAGKTTREAADQAAELLARRQAPLVGIVLVGSHEAASAKYYYDDEESYLRRRRRVKTEKSRRAERLRRNGDGAIADRASGRGESADAGGTAAAGTAEAHDGSGFAPTWVDAHTSNEPDVPLVGLTPAPRLDISEAPVTPRR